MEKPRPSFSSENTSQKMFIGTDKISEIVNDLDSDGGSFSELSDSDMCKVSSPYGSSSSEEEEDVQQNLTEARRENARPFLNAQIQTLSQVGKNKFRWFSNLHSPVYQG